MDLIDIRAATKGIAGKESRFVKYTIQGIFGFNNLPTSYGVCECV